MVCFLLGTCESTTNNGILALSSNFYWQISKLRIKRTFLNYLLSDAIVRVLLKFGIEILKQNEKRGWERWDKGRAYELQATQYGNREPLFVESFLHFICINFFIRNTNKFTQQRFLKILNIWILRFLKVSYNFPQHLIAPTTNASSNTPCIWNRPYLLERPIEWQVIK